MFALDSAILHIFQCLDYRSKRLRYRTSQPKVAISQPLRWKIEISQSFEEVAISAIRDCIAEASARWNACANELREHSTGQISPTTELDSGYHISFPQPSVFDENFVCLIVKPASDL